MHFYLVVFRCLQNELEHGEEKTTLTMKYYFHLCAIIEAKDNISPRRASVFPNGILFILLQ